VEKLSKIKADADKQLVKDMTQIKDLAAERDLQILFSTSQFSSISVKLIWGLNPILIYFNISST